MTLYIIVTMRLEQQKVKQGRNNLSLCLITMPWKFTGRWR